MQADRRSAKRVPDSMMRHIVVYIGHTALLESTGGQKPLRCIRTISFFLQGALQHFKNAPAFRVTVDSRKIARLPMDQYYFEQRVVDEDMPGRRIFHKPVYFRAIKTIKCFQDGNKLQRGIGSAGGKECMEQVEANPAKVGNVATGNLGGGFVGQYGVLPDRCFRRPIGECREALVVPGRVARQNVSQVRKSGGSGNGDGIGGG